MIASTDTSGSLVTWFRAAYAPRVLRGRSPHTVELYQITLRHWTRHLGRAPTFADLTDDAVGAFLAARADQVSAETANKDHANLCAIWRYANRLRLVDTWPTLPRLVAPRRVPQAWTEGELRRLFAEASKSPGTIGRVPTGAWWRALLLVLWNTGERIGAVWSLTWADVDLAGGWVRVPAESRKGRREDRLYRLAPEAVAALRPLRANGSAAVFATHFGRQALWIRMRRLLLRAGLPADRKSKFHRIRKTVASYVQAAGGDAQAVLGHSSPRVTRAYLDPRITGTPQAVDWLPRLG